MCAEETETEDVMNEEFDYDNGLDYREEYVGEENYMSDNSSQIVA